MLDDEDIEAIADRVAAKLRLPTDGLVGVRDVARALGMSRAWVYRNADELGAQRLGGGRKPALRFDLARTLERAVGLAFLPCRFQRSRPRVGVVARRMAHSPRVWS
jgi:hypothetical protein